MQIPELQFLGALYYWISVIWRQKFYCTHLVVPEHPEVALISVSVSRLPLIARTQNRKFTQIWRHRLQGADIPTQILWESGIPDRWLPLILEDDDPTFVTPQTALYSWAREAGRAGVSRGAG